MTELALNASEYCEITLCKTKKKGVYIIDYFYWDNDDNLINDFLQTNDRKVISRMKSAETLLQKAEILHAKLTDIKIIELKKSVKEMGSDIKKLKEELSQHIDFNK